MRLSQANPSRPQYYDRNPTEQTQAFSSGDLAPHALTARWTYTVPTGRKAFVDAGDTDIVRTAAAAPVGGASTQINETPNGGSATILSLARIFDNTVGARSGKTLGGSVSMLPGAAITGYTSDASTGGTCRFEVSMHAVEFDA